MGLFFRFKVPEDWTYLVESKVFHFGFIQNGFCEGD